MPDEGDPFAVPHPGSVGPAFKGDFDVDTSAVGKLSHAMEDLSKKTDKAEASLGKLETRTTSVRKRIEGILQGGGLKVGGDGGGRGGGNGGSPTVGGTAGGGSSGGGNGNGGVLGKIGRAEGGTQGILALDFGLDLMRYMSNVQVPGYSRMQKMLGQGLPLDAYATQWSGAYGLAPSQIPSRLTKGGAIGTPAQVAGAAQYGANMGAIPGANQVGNSYWSSVNQLQRLAPGMGPEAAAQVSGNLMNPAVVNQISMRYGMAASPMAGGKLKPFNQSAADILKAIRRNGAQAGSLPTKEELIAGLLPGSRMRQQMRVGMNLDDETITMILNWGIQNSSYASKGGKGNYDPSDLNSRKLATGSGTKDSLSNYAQTYQQAQTGQVSNFMQGQYGSMQDMVQAQTDLTDMMTKVDDGLTGFYKIIGPVGPVITSVAGFIGEIGSAIIALRAFSVAVGGAGGASGVGGAASGAAGAAGAAGAGGAAAGAAEAGGAAAAEGLGGATLGSVFAAGAAGAYFSGKLENQSRKAAGKKPVGMIPNILHGDFNPLDWFGDIPIGDPQIAGMSGDFRKKLGAMMSANPNLTVTSGYRSASQQAGLAGVGKVGPAGDSWHVRGQAADLGPPSQFGWVAKNAAKFGLDTGGKWGEPWHVQPRGTAGKRPTPNLAINQSARGSGAASRGARAAIGDIPGLSISDTLARTLSVNASSLFSSGAGGAATGQPGSGGGQTPVSTAGSGQVDKVLNYALAQVGKPYEFGKQGPDSFDCSGLVTASYKQIGITLPALTFSQVKMGTAVPVDANAVRPGDALFMHGGSPPVDFGHVALALSGSQMISAPHSGAVVHVSSIPWGSVQAVRRYVNASATAAQTGGSPSMSGTWQDFLQSHMETSGKLDPNATMSGPTIAATFYNAGFRGNVLTDMVAISGRESGWNPTAFNFHAQSTGDISLGLVQENIKGSMSTRLAAAGLSDPRQLFNAANAARAAFILSSGGSDLSPWGGYKGMSNTYGTNMQSAQQAVSQAQAQGLIGDIPLASGGTNAGGASAPVAQMSYAMAGAVPGGGGGGVNVTLNFHVTTTGSDQSQGLRIAQTASQALREQLTKARTM